MVTMKCFLSFCLCILASLAWQDFVWAGSEMVSVSGRIVDAHGAPVAGAEVYAYRTPNVKKPADFVSKQSGADGRYQVSLPVGEFYLVAILRQSGATFGPLEVGDKHSGEARPFEFSADMAGLDIVVMDLREVALKEQKRNEDLLRLSGRLLGGDSDRPLKMAYVLANKGKRAKKIPDYFSAWSDVSGGYVLFLPKGKYYLAGALAFPPDPAYVHYKEINLDGDMAGIDIVVEGQ